MKIWNSLDWIYTQSLTRMGVRQFFLREDRYKWSSVLNGGGGVKLSANYGLLW